MMKLKNCGMNTKNYCIKLIAGIALLALFVGGCSVAFYGRLGPQEIRDVKFSLEHQESDPNMNVIGTLAEILKVL